MIGGSIDSIACHSGPDIGHVDTRTPAGVRTRRRHASFDANLSATSRDVRDDGPTYRAPESATTSGTYQTSWRSTATRVT
jgi:hypothetical protein